MVPVNIWFWVGFIAFVLVMLALDLGVFHRHAHEVRAKEAGTWTAVWVGLALVFAAGLYFVVGRHSALTFLTGYVIEEALSADNIFVMVLIFEYFRVPKSSQHRVLFYGILGALVMRGAFIAAGSALITRFHWVLYVFGGLLVTRAILDPNADRRGNDLRHRLGENAHAVSDNTLLNHSPTNFPCWVPVQPRASRAGFFRCDRRRELSL